MKNLKVVALVVLLTSCSTMQPPRYSVSVDNVEALRALGDAQLTVSSFSQSANFDSNCRLMGPIEPADGQSIPEFIANAFNDEFKMAEVHSDSGTRITGDVTEVRFSSISGLTNGYWEISISLTSSNGNSLDVASRYEFRSGFDAVTACNATADALTPAVQDLIQATITNPGFAEML